MDYIVIKDCWARGFSVEEAAERSYTSERSIRLRYKELDKKMREFFLEQEKDI